MVREHHFRHVRLIGCVLASLCGTATAGSAAATAASALIIDPSKGNCTACHFVPVAGLPSNAFGNIGPSLEGVGSRLTPAQVRMRIVDPRSLASQTVMPAYGSTTGLYRVQSAYRGRPILTDREIDAVVTYLSALK
jgi:sulfur-oxidizing protein SoxX